MACVFTFLTLSLSLVTGIPIITGMRHETPFERIVSGENSKAGKHPYIVSVQFLYKHDNENNREYYMPTCAGVILDDSTILTASHCFHYKPPCWEADPLRCWRIVAGDYDLSNDNEGTEQIRHVPVDDIIRHEGYDGFHYYNDIAIMNLNVSLKFNEYVQCIALPDPTSHYKNYGEIAGWGYVNTSGPTSNILQEAIINIYPDEHCFNAYGDDFKERHMICAGGWPRRDRIWQGVESGESDELSLEPDACTGDSGGPLVVPDAKREWKKHLVGIVSWGFECGIKDYPGIYTRVSSYLDWIYEQKPSLKQCRRQRQRRRKNAPRLRKHRNTKDRNSCGSKH